MADTVTSPRGAEISERSTELVLPDEETVAAPLRREFGVSESEATTQVLRDRGDGAQAPSESSRAARAKNAEKARSAALAGGLTSNGTSSPPPQTGTPKTTGLANSLTTPPGTSETAPPETRGVALPGDRGPRNQAAQTQRPSFWRRIALGRRNTPETPVAPPEAQTQPPAPASTPAVQKSPTLAERAMNAVAPAPTVDTKAIENVIVEPMLQALVSVEAKLERSHTEIVGRSDAVEQRLTQLWDIEEQLGTLSELQESLLQVSEQQRRLETAVVSQTKTLRWLVGAVFFSLAAAAFVVAAVLR